LTYVKIFLVRFFHKIVGLEVALFSEKAENCWFILCMTRRHPVITRL